MERIEFFYDFDRVLPGLIKTLAQLAEIQTQKKGDMIFRQGDPAVDCYVVISGEVTLHQRNDHQASPRRLGPPEKKSAFADYQDDSGKSCFERFMDFIINPPSSELPEEVIVEKRWYTTERHNTYSKESKIGEILCTLGPDQIFGELGLLESHPRSATAKCTVDTQFFVIPQKPFLEMFGGAINTINKDKLFLLARHVPGFQEWGNANMLRSIVSQDGRRTALMENHPAHAFKKQEVPPGHKFLREGEIAKPQVIVLAQGEVEFQRQCFMFPRKIPLKATDCETPAKSSNASNLEPLTNVNTPLDRANTTCHTLSIGGLFCSLGVFGLPSPEPFTVVATRPSVVYSADADSLSRLPESIKSAIQYHLVDTLKPLLGRSPAFNSCYALPQWFALPSQMEDHWTFEELGGSFNLPQTFKEFGGSFDLPPTFDELRAIEAPPTCEELEGPSDLPRLEDDPTSLSLARAE